jgi:5-methylcytosine-specific restriction endonuclease McrA
VDFAAQNALERLRFPVAKRDRFRCRRCVKYLRKSDRSFHHVIPRDEGGPTVLDNLILLCGPCHDLVEIHEPPLRNHAAIEGSWSSGFDGEPAAA